MQEIAFIIDKDSLLGSKTSCFTLKNEYDRDIISVILDN